MVREIHESSVYTEIKDTVVVTPSPWVDNGHVDGVGEESCLHTKSQVFLDRGHSDPING